MFLVRLSLSGRRRNTGSLVPALAFKWLLFDVTW